MYSHESESILLGATILGADASKKYPSLTEAMNALNVAGRAYAKLAKNVKFTSNGKTGNGNAFSVRLYFYESKQDLYWKFTVRVCSNN